MTAVQNNDQLRDLTIECLDGLATGVSIKVDGEPITNCLGVEWSVWAAGEPGGGISRATLYCEVVPGDFKANLVRFLPAPGTRLRDRLRLALTILRRR